MKYINSLLFLSYPLFVIAGNGGFIKVPFDVKKGAGVRTSPIINKEQVDPGEDVQMKDVQDTVDVDLTLRATFYSVNLNIGSNGDSVEVLLDTGSSDLWVVGADNEDCQVNGGPNDCNQYGTFDEQNSTSWTTNQQVFSIKYADNTTAQGYYGQDKIDFGDGMVLSTGTFAVANQSNDTFGVFGIGFEANEATANKYTNIPSSLKTEGLINKVAYSLYINSENATTGSILFGGIDNAKYQDDLVPINIVQNNGEYSKMQIHLSSIKVCLNNSCSDVANSPLNSLSSSSSVSSSSLSFSSDGSTFSSTQLQTETIESVSEVSSQHSLSTESKSQSEAQIISSPETASSSDSVSSIVSASEIELTTSSSLPSSLSSPSLSSRTSFSTSMDSPIPYYYTPQTSPTEEVETTSPSTLISTSTNAPVSLSKSVPALEPITTSSEISLVQATLTNIIPSLSTSSSIGHTVVDLPPVIKTVTNTITAATSTVIIPFPSKSISGEDYTVALSPPDFDTTLQSVVVQASTNIEPSPLTSLAAEGYTVADFPPDFTTTTALQFHPTTLKTITIGTYTVAASTLAASTVSPQAREKDQPVSTEDIESWLEQVRQLMSALSQMAKQLAGNNGTQPIENVDLPVVSKREDGVVDTANAPFMIDSGSTYCDFPSQIITSIADQAAPGYQYSQALGGNEVPCSLKDDGNSLQLTFDNKKMIEVPFKDLILDKTNPSTGAPACILKLGYSDYSVLGLDFLKHAYTVFNLDDKTISLAQMIYTQDENISAIE